MKCQFSSFPMDLIRVKPRVEFFATTIRKAALLLHDRFTLSSVLTLLAVAALCLAVALPAQAQPRDLDPTIVVHAGGIRADNSSTVGPLPNGAVFTAQANDNSSLRFTCTTSGGTGTCTISGLPDGHAWVVRETTAPDGYYLNPQLATGGETTTASRNYAFRTGILNGNTTTDVPAATPNILVTDGNNQQFSGLLATSLDNPPPGQHCGLNIALVLDQSGSMAGTKQTALQTAARDLVGDLTGTPSTIAIFTFASSTGPSIGKTSTINAASAEPLIDFINALPTPVGGTNWDLGLGQVTNQGFDLVIFLTDGAPTFNRLGGTGNRTAFADIEQAIFSANSVKNGGARIVGIGIGLPAGVDVNLRAVTGPQVNQDFFLAESDTFGDILRNEATGECTKELEITKLLQDSNGTLINPTPTDANGVNFSNTISSGGTIAPTATTGLVNGINGIASAAVTITGRQTPIVTLTETVPAGQTFVGAQCFVAGTPVPTTVTGTSATFTTQPAQPLSCTFTNRRQPVGPPIAIQHFPSGGGRVGTTISDTAIVTGGNRPTGTVTFRLFGPNETDCDETQAQFVVFTSTNTLTGGTATSNAFTTTAAGTFHWLATYNGDANNPRVSTACTPVTIVAR